MRIRNRHSEPARPTITPDELPPPRHATAPARIPCAHCHHHAVVVIEPIGSPYQRTALCVNCAVSALSRSDHDVTLAGLT